MEPGKGEELGLIPSARRAKESFYCREQNSIVCPSEVIISICKSLPLDNDGINGGGDPPADSQGHGTGTCQPERTSTSQAPLGQGYWWYTEIHPCITDGITAWTLWAFSMILQRNFPAINFVMLQQLTSISCERVFFLVLDVTSLCRRVFLSWMRVFACLNWI